jgi:predicted transcriptional regulator YheO
MGTETEIGGKRRVAVMKDLHDEMGFFQTFMKQIASLFGENCEVVLHDLKNRPYESTIIAIENGQVTGRRVGDCGTNLGLQVLRGEGDRQTEDCYVTHTKEGRILRSTSIYIRDDNGAVIGCLCINYDISDLLIAQRTLQAVTKHSLETAPPNPSIEEYFAHDVNDLLDYLIQESIQQVGKPVAMMNRDDKVSGLSYLDKKGAFLIKKSGDRVAKFYDISKYTLYSYLEEARS